MKITLTIKFEDNFQFKLSDLEQLLEKYFEKKYNKEVLYIQVKVE